MKAQKLRRITVGGLVVLFSVLGRMGHGQTFELVHTFVYPDMGRYPDAGLVLGNNGALYGTTYQGGTNTAGWVYKLTPDGTVSDVASFGSQNGSGAWPEVAMILGCDGNFYGATTDNTIFKMTPDGGLTGLYHMDYSEGSQPNVLVQGTDGFLYGTAYYGGTNGDSTYGAAYGTAFKISTNGVFTRLLCFDGTNGIAPAGPLIQTKDGNLYGTTSQTKDFQFGYGTFFRMTTNGVLTTLLRFDRYNAGPGGPLFPVADGSFYGVAGSGTFDVGNIFRITTNGVLSPIASFDYTNGMGPTGLVRAMDGNYYGTCVRGGAWNIGTVFELTKENKIQNIFEFHPPEDEGFYPTANLAEGPDGNLYGTASEGGWNDVGTIFRIVIPRPKLNVARAGDEVVLSWRTNYATLHLQSISDLNSNNWTNCPPAAISGTNYVFTNPISGNSFFRLKR